MKVTSRKNQGWFAQCARDCSDYPALYNVDGKTIGNFPEDMIFETFTVVAEGFRFVVLEHEGTHYITDPGAWDYPIYGL